MRNPGIRSYSIRMFTARRFLNTLGALGAACASCTWAPPLFSSYPFMLGVASGYPSPTSVALWTRLMGPLEPGAIAVRWEIAADDAMRNIVASGEAAAEPRWSHSVHVEAAGLQA